MATHLCHQLRNSPTPSHLYNNFVCPELSMHFLATSHAFLSFDMTLQSMIAHPNT
jgi:hypothetical protein